MRKGFELNEIDHRDAAVGGGDVGVQPQARTKKRGAMLAQQHDQSGEGQRGEQEVDAKVFRTVHAGLGIVAWEEEAGKQCLNVETESLRVTGSKGRRVAGVPEWEFEI